MVLGWGSKKVQTHHDDDDMSMEEILASIRKYVSEETAPKEPEPFQDTVKVMDSPYRNESSLRAQSRHSDETVSELSPSNTFEDSALFGNTGRPSNIEEFAVTRDVLKTKPVVEELSARDDAAVSTTNPFAKLSEATKNRESAKMMSAESRKDALTLDQLISDLARPMIQKWLDQHMTTIVEKMVAQEIAKMTGSK
jgi:cell pole-organizing protein PopZ